MGEYALTQDIENAIKLLYEARNANMPFILYLRQGNAFEGYVHERFSAFEMLLAEEMSAGVEQFRQVLTLYNTSAINEANGQTSMFGVRSPEDIKNEILDRYGKQQNQGSTSQETANATSSTQPSDGRETRTETEDGISGGRKVSESVSQGEHREVASLSGRTEEASHRLGERIQSASRNLPNGSQQERRESENRVTREFAQENGLWIPFSDIDKLGLPFLSGDEHNNYIDEKFHVIYKVNNRIHTPSILELLDRMEQHNKLFPNTKYTLI